jgi:hypothetical protein
MACIDEIVCLGEACSCGNQIELPLVAQHTGIYRMIAKFNGVRITRNIEVIEGENIVIPNVFNENYTHEIWFETQSGALVNDVHYSIKLVFCLSPENEEMSTENSIRVLADADDTVIDDRLIGKTVTAYIINDISKNTDFSKPIASNTFVTTNGVTFPANSIVTIIFE